MWLLITIVAYLINAGVYTADKFLLSKRVHSSIAYAFYVGIWSIGNLALLYFAPFMPTWPWLLLDLLAGLLFLWALVAWYKALHQSEATKVVPIVGALIPIFSLIMGWLFLGEKFTEQKLLAFAVLIAGGLLISMKKKGESKIRKLWLHFGILLGFKGAEFHPIRRLLINSVAAALLFSSFYVLIKFIYLHQPFLGSYVWTRMGSFVGAILLILPARNRQIILEKQKRQVTIKTLPFFLAVRIAAVIAFILLNYAISLGEVALVNAIQGVQYAFLIIIVGFLSHAYPKILKEEVGREVLVQKLIGVFLIGIGLYMLI